MSTLKKNNHGNVGDVVINIEAVRDTSGSIIGDKHRVKISIEGGDYGIQGLREGHLETKRITVHNIEAEKCMGVVQLSVTSNSKGKNILVTGFVYNTREGESTFCVEVLGLNHDVEIDSANITHQVKHGVIDPVAGNGG